MSASKTVKRVAKKMFDPLNKFFEDQSVVVLEEWPANSPDLNPIENLCGWIKRKMAPLKRTSLEDWRSKLKKIWQEIPTELLENLVLSRFSRFLSNKLSLDHMSTLYYQRKNTRYYRYPCDT